MVILREIKFGPFRIDPTNCCIWHGTIKRNLPPKDFALLNVLASSPGILVTKKELLKTVWAQTSVGDHVLKTCIGRIRKILQDDHKTPKYIETVHRRGYRFVCQTKIEQVGISPTAPQISIPHSIVGRTYELKKLFDLLEFARIGTRQTLGLLKKVDTPNSQVV
jgi:DNA-binding winged helix-turn-helix (wHTH) protein